mmetsp:Transcript_67733/g.83025  ORF Transcript_67733/g.83025 Transcript_67733/m.83025 type:complete len:381 (-) Transcript_67733:103-1245(-)
MNKPPFFEYYLAYFIIGFVCWIAYLIILYIHCKRKHQSNQIQSISHALSQNIPIYLYGFDILFIIIRSICHVYPYYILNDMICKIFNYTGVVLYFASKTSLYIAFASKLQNLFRNTEYQYSNRVTVSLYISIILFGILCIVLTPFTQEYYYDSNEMSCNGNQPILGFVVVILLDILMSLLCLYLYIRKLTDIKLKLINQNKINDINMINDHAIKGVICISFCVIISFAYLLSFSITKLSIGIPINDLANIIGLMLLHDHFGGFYNKLCCLCHKTCLSFQRAKPINILPAKVVHDRINIQTTPESSQIGNAINMDTISESMITDTQNEGKSPSIINIIIHSDDMKQDIDNATPGIRYKETMMQQISYYIDTASVISSQIST